MPGETQHKEKIGSPVGRVVISAFGQASAFSESELDGELLYHYSAILRSWADTSHWEATVRRGDGLHLIARPNSAGLDALAIERCMQLAVCSRASVENTIASVVFENDIKWRDSVDSDPHSWQVREVINPYRSMDPNEAIESITGLSVSRLEKLFRSASFSDEQRMCIKRALATTHANLSEVDAERERDFFELTKEHVFQGAKPSADGFRAYLKRLKKSDSDTSYKQKKEICRTVNFWKRHFGLSLYYKRQKCTLTAKTSGKLGGYNVRTADSEREHLHTEKAFPPLTAR